LKQFASISLILLLTWQTFFKAAFVIYWKANQTYITQNFCENKDKPKMKCCGKCYLNKQLKKVDQGESNSKDFPFSIFKIKSIDNFILNSTKYFYNSIIIDPSEIIGYSYYDRNICNGCLNSLFRPPKFI